MPLNGTEITLLWIWVTICFQLKIYNFNIFSKNELNLTKMEMEYVIKFLNNSGRVIWFASLNSLPSYLAFCGAYGEEMTTPPSLACLWWRNDINEVKVWENPRIPKLLWGNWYYSWFLLHCILVSQESYYTIFIFYVRLIFNTEYLFKSCLGIWCKFFYK